MLFTNCSCCFWSDLHQVGEDLLSKRHWSSVGLLWKSWGNQPSSSRRISRKNLPTWRSWLYPGSNDLYSGVLKSVVQGAEFEVFHGNPLQHLSEENAPCAVCDVPTRARVIMVPAKTVCPPSWTREYYGYLMTAHDGYYRSSYTCIDVNSEPIRGESSDTNTFYHTVTDCNGLLCPPYENNRQLSCVVCTKWLNILNSTKYLT
jgi:hypothetical protein